MKNILPNEEFIKMEKKHENCKSCKNCQCGNNMNDSLKLNNSVKVKKDIENLEDVKLLVDNFYSTIRHDDLLKRIFNDVVGDRWGEHVEKMYKFWQTILLDERTYSGSPFPPHLKLPVEHSHFKHWASLFLENIDKFFEGKKADEAKWRAQQMSELFAHKHKYLTSSIIP